MQGINWRDGWKINEKPKSVPSDQIRTTNRSGELDWLLRILELLIKQMCRGLLRMIKSRNKNLRSGCNQVAVDDG